MHKAKNFRCCLYFQLFFIMLNENTLNSFPKQILNKLLLLKIIKSVFSKKKPKLCQENLKSNWRYDLKTIFYFRLFLKFPNIGLSLLFQNNF